MRWSPTNPHGSDRRTRTVGAVLASASDADRATVLGSWAGSAPSARDFQLGSVGVEVKTTQGASSVHHIEGVHQVELGHSNQGVAETALFLLSLGIGWVASEDEGHSLPELVDSILTSFEIPMTDSTSWPG